VKFTLERRSIPGSQGLLDPVGNFSAEFQSQGKPPVQEALAINYARVSLQVSVRRLDQQPLIRLPSVPHQHTYSQRADVLGSRPFTRRRLLVAGDLRVWPAESFFQVVQTASAFGDPPSFGIAGPGWAGPIDRMSLHKTQRSHFFANHVAYTV
jgi:hypothetical protein